MGNLAHEALERELPDEEHGRLLELPDLAERHGTRAVPARLLDAAHCGRGLARRKGRELLPWGFASGRSAGGLLRSGHCCCVMPVFAPFSRKIVCFLFK